MHVPVGTRTLRQITTLMLAAVLAGLGMLPTATTAQSGPAPTVGEIVVDSHDCSSGQLAFHVPVTDLPHVPDDTDFTEYPLANVFRAHYETGSYIQLPPSTFNPQAEVAPYTGNVYLTRVIPPTNGYEPSNPAVTSVDLTVYVGYGGPGNDAYTNPTDTSTTTYDVDCSSEEPDVDVLVEQIIAILIAILADL
ncbi:MAG TPA: hypothetical protein VD789_04560 [Thermomicrobiales bacterium]|nr:hypothetical protein [Thermomicrobiales bacterium]